jgi:cytochrome c
MRSLALLFFCLASTQAVAQTAAPAGNVARGKLVFLECQACHAVAPGGPTLVGPDLFGVYGRKAGSLVGYQFSDALKSSGLVWNDTNLDRWHQDGIHRHHFASAAGRCDRLPGDA